MGIERARLGAAFAARSFSDDDRQALAALLSARRSYLHIFAATAPRAAEELLERALASTVEADLARAEELILAGREGETDLDARGWFNLTSRKIDLLPRSAWRRWGWWRPANPPGLSRPRRLGAGDGDPPPVDAHRVGAEAHRRDRRGTGRCAGRSSA